MKSKNQAKPTQHNDTTTIQHNFWKCNRDFNNTV